MENIGKTKKKENGICTRHNPSVRRQVSTAGITLIALIVTIIVLIILAGVAIAMLRGDNGILNRAQEAKYLNSIGAFDEQIKLSYMSVRASISSNTVSQEGYIATKTGAIKDLADEVAKELGVTATKAPAVSGSKIATEGYTVEYYLDTEGNEATDGNGYIVIWYTDNSLRSTMKREEVIARNGLVDATENKSVNEAVLVQVIKIENYGCELSNKGLTSVTDGNKDIGKESFGATSLNGKLGFTGIVPPAESAEGQPAGTPVKNPASYGTNPNAQATADGNDNIFALPTGASYDGTTSVDEGLVITYKGSEFVWIPVNSDLTVKGTSKLMAKESTGSFAGTDENGRTNYEGVLYDDNLNERTGYGQNNTSGYREPSDLQHTSYGDWSTDSDKGFALIKKHITGMSDKTNDEIKTEWPKQLQKEYNAMIESVQKYGGFYVGRYESSLNGNSAKSVSGVKPMSAAATEGDTWYGLYQRQKNFTTSTDSMVASMIWGSQYDAMLNWAKASGTTTGSHVTSKGYGNHNNTTKAVECGSYNNGSDIINNIYDLEGNLIEWTLESNNTYSRVHRGGGYFYNEAPAFYSYGFPNDAGEYSSSRLSLYVK